jgi:hypothetical protein
MYVWPRRPETLPPAASRALDVQRRRVVVQPRPGEVHAAVIGAGAVDGELRVDGVGVEGHRSVAGDRHVAGVARGGEVEVGLGPPGVETRSLTLALRGREDRLKRFPAQERWTL